MLSHTFGRFTFGMMTSFNALGASFFARDVSPPGWYWYLPDEPVFHGSLSGTVEMACSEVEEVGLREKCQPTNAKAPVMMVSRICIATSRQISIPYLPKLSLET